MVKIITPQENTIKTISKIESYISSFTYPLYMENDNGRPELVGSCVSIQLGGKNCLCTAAHTYEYFEKYKKLIFIGSGRIENNGGFQLINGNVSLLRNSKGVEFDICLIELLSHNENMNFLSQEKILLSGDIKDPSFTLIQGYPISKNKHNNPKARKNNIIRSGFHTHVVLQNWNIDFAKHKKDVNWHIPLNYKKGLRDGKIIDPPFPRGLSGGGVWVVKDAFKPEEYFLQGIFIEYSSKDQLGFATRTEAIKLLQ